MKRIMIALLIGLASFTYEAKAQWTVIDPSNLAQNIRNVIQTSSTASNMMKNLEENVKIYQQGKEYYDALKSVHNLIKDARKVQKTIELVSEITDIYVTSFNKMVSDPNYTPEELAAISFGYTLLLEEGAEMLVELKNVVTPSNGLSMSDKERMDMIDRIYHDIKNYRNLTLYYTQKNIAVSYLRAWEKNQVDRVIALYGSGNEKYW